MILSFWGKRPTFRGELLVSGRVRVQRGWCVFFWGCRSFYFFRCMDGAWKIINLKENLIDETTWWEEPTKHWIIFLEVRAFSFT